MRKIYIYSCGGGGREIIRLINEINKDENQWEVIGYIDDDPNKQGQIVDNLKVFSPKEIIPSGEEYCICGIMDPVLRKKITNDFIIPKGFKAPTLIHPAILIYEDTKIDVGAVIYAGVHISYNVKIGKHILLSSNSVIGHDSKIGDYVSIMSTSTINGECNVGSECVLGAGSVIHPGISIGNNSIVGIGTTVLNDLASNKTLMDMPKRAILEREIKTKM